MFLLKKNSYGVLYESNTHVVPVNYPQLPIKDRGETINEYTWHVQSKKPDLIAETFPKVILLMADGDELENIKTRFVNVPYAHKITTWKGTMAQFIYDNLL